MFALRLYSTGFGNRLKKNLFVFEMSSSLSHLLVSLPRKPACTSGRRGGSLKCIQTEKYGYVSYLSAVSLLSMCVLL